MADMRASERSWMVWGLASVLVPPLGLALLWTRSKITVGTKLLGTLALVALAIGYVYSLVGFRVELDGSGRWPRFSFQTQAAHYADLEADRAMQRQRSPVAAPVDRDPSENAPSGTGSVRPLGEGIGAQPNVAPPPATTSNARATSPSGTYWTSFRGPNRDGRYDETEILTSWPREGPRRLWRQPTGGGYASFVVAEGRAFTIEQRRDQEVVASYDVETGRELWTHGWDGHFSESTGGDGPRATPTWDEGRLYALGAEGELRCLDVRTGTLIWRRNILTDNQAINLNWGMAASPLIVDDKVIVLPGGSPGKSVVAYHKLTGATIWKSLDDPQAYTSPMLVTLADQRQILVVSARRAVGIAVEDGSLLWEYPWTTEMDLNIAQPVLLGKDRVFLSAGYGHGGAVFQVTRSGGGFTAATIWENRRMKNKFTSSVLYEGHLYGLDEAVLACVDAETGELKWKGGRYGYGQVVLASSHLIVLSESGDLALVRATPERFQELARFSAIDGKTWNHPTIAAGRLLVRNENEMAAFDIARR